jgi:hypothetical protein
MSGSPNPYHPLQGIGAETPSPKLGAIIMSGSPNPYTRRTSFAMHRRWSGSPEETKNVIRTLARSRGRGGEDHNLHVTSIRCRAVASLGCNPAASHHLGEVCILCIGQALNAGVLARRKEQVPKALGLGAGLQLHGSLGSRRERVRNDLKMITALMKKTIREKEGPGPAITSKANCPASGEVPRVGAAQASGRVGKEGCGSPLPVR